MVNCTCGVTPLHCCEDCTTKSRGHAGAAAGALHCTAPASLRRSHSRSCVLSNGCACACPYADLHYVRRAAEAGCRRPCYLDNVCKHFHSQAKARHSLACTEPQVVRHVVFTVWCQYTPVMLSSLNCLQMWQRLCTTSLQGSLRRPLAHQVLRLPARSYKVGGNVQWNAQRQDRTDHSTITHCKSFHRAVVQLSTCWVCTPLPGSPRRSANTATIILHKLVRHQSLTLLCNSIAGEVVLPARRVPHAVMSQLHCMEACAYLLACYHIYLEGPHWRRRSLTHAVCVQRVHHSLPRCCWGSTQNS